MNVAKWAGVFAAALALGCAGQQSESRTTAANPRADAQSGGAPDATAANEQAPSQRPSSGVGSQDPHPVVTNPSDPQYGGNEAAREGQVARPGLEGRPGVQREGSSSAGRASSGTASSNDVYGQVNEISDDEMEIEPAYGEPIKLKLDERIKASADSLDEGDEVRASYDQHGTDKVAVDVEPDPSESTIRDLMPSSGTTSPMGSDSSPSNTSSGTSSGTAPMGSEPSRGSDKSDR
jgi:hypothetical protein